jgi:hypothetical protein
MVNWLSICWCLTFWAVSGLSLGCSGRLRRLPLSLAVLPSLSRLPQVKVLESFDESDSTLSELWLVLEDVGVAGLESDWDMLSESDAESDLLRRARRTRSRIDMIVRLCLALLLVMEEENEIASRRYGN